MPHLRQFELEVELVHLKFDAELDDAVGLFRSKSIERLELMLLFLGLSEK